MPTYRQTVTFEYDVDSHEYPHMGSRDYFAVNGGEYVGSGEGSISPYGRELRIVDAQPAEKMKRKITRDDLRSFEGVTFETSGYPKGTNLHRVWCDADGAVRLASQKNGMTLATGFNVEEVLRFLNNGVWAVVE